MKLRAELSPESVVAIIDSREQHPLPLSPLQTIVEGLDTGDYSVKGMEHQIAVERKSLSDLLSCIGMERERFEREIQRLLAFPHRALVVESNWQTIEAGQWRSQITASAAVGSLIGWAACGLPIFMCDNHERAGRFVSRFLYTCARRRWQECRTLAAGILEPEAVA